MIGLIGNLRIAPTRAAEFTEGFSNLAAVVKQNEPGVLLYALCKSRTEADVFKVMELYETDADLKAHLASDHFRSLWPPLKAMLSEPPHGEFLDVVE